MKKEVGLSILFFLIGYFSFAQDFTVKGILVDKETNNPLPGITVVMQNAIDTNVTKASITDSRGKFAFNGYFQQGFTLVFTAVGYEPLVKRMLQFNTETTAIDFGAIGLSRMSKELDAVVVRARPPLAQQKGDTLQFNASQFKTNPDASSEDLVRKVPGITVENGEVRAQGQVVRRVTLDGRELFGDDAIAALRNLPAEVVDKIQVLDRLSDQDKASGVTTGETQKEINIVTRVNMRNGQFGRVFAGYGTNNRYLVGGNNTILRGNRRISVVALANNVNRQNFSSQDLLGVTGGENGRGGNFQNANNFTVGQQNGINKTTAVGINYSDNWGDKMRVSGSYFFNRGENITSQVTNIQYFSTTIPDIHQTRNSISKNDNNRFNFRMEYNLDSFNKIIVTPNISFQKNNSNSLRHNQSVLSGQLLNDTKNSTHSDRSGASFNNTIFYSHRFYKPGRNFSINLNTAYNKREGVSYLDVLRTVYTNNISDDTTERRFTDQFNNGSQLSTNISYTEPLGKKSQLQVSYNPSYSKNTSEQEVYDYNTGTGKYSIFRDSLTNVFDNDTRVQNAGLAYRLGDVNNQFTAGVNYQNTTMENERTFPSVVSINKKFSNFLPNAMMRLKLSRNSTIRLHYRTATNTPWITQLQDVVNPNNRPFLSSGNPNLKQQYTHILSSNYRFTNTASGILLVGDLFAQKTDDYITNATYSLFGSDSAIGNGEVLKPGEQLTKPVNLDGYMNLRSYLTFAMPVKWIKSNLNLNGGIAYVKQPGLINSRQSMSNNVTFSLGTVLASNISEFVDFTISYSANFNTVHNDLRADLNQKYFSHSGGLQFHLLSQKGWFLHNDINNRLYTGLGEGFNQNFWLWNAGIGKKFLKDKKGELKVSVFDLLKQNRSVNRTILDDGGIRDDRNVVLTQYFMLTFTYNLRNWRS